MIDVANNTDILVVGAGISGATVARIAAENGLHVHVFDKRDHLAGNCHTELNDFNVLVHVYGAHIFHTNSDSVWEFVNRFATFDPYTHKVVTLSRGKTYSMPINALTLASIISEQGNLREYADLVDIARERFMLHYTEKQWNKPITEVPGNVLARVKMRHTSDDRYFTDKHQGIPREGYTRMVENMLDHPNITVTLGAHIKLKQVKGLLESKVKHVYWSGIVHPVNETNLPWRSVMFQHEIESANQIMPVAVVNYADKFVPFTRQIEHKQFMSAESRELHGTSTFETVITSEFPCKPTHPDSIGPAYPVRTDENIQKFNELVAFHKERCGNGLTFGGRLGTFTYIDMDQAINSAMKTANKIIKNVKSL